MAAARTDFRFEGLSKNDRLKTLRGASREGSLGSRIAFILGGLLGLIAGAGGMLIAFPFIFPPPVVSEAPPGAGATTVSRLGTFQFDEQAPGRDLIHWTNGTGGIYRSDRMIVIRFDDNFRAGPGPNYWVSLNTVSVGEAAAFKADAGRMKLAPLKSFSGGQNYTVPDRIDIARFRTVTIWCESFSAYIGSAALPKS
jgi:hypothetical protein